MEVGDTITKQRTFTNEEIIAFGELTRNTGLVHIEPDEFGRLMVQGLLTASIITEIGGELGLLGQNMNFSFVRAVYTGDTITCNLHIDRIEELDRSSNIFFSSEFINLNNKIVLTADGKGVLIKTG